MEEFVINLEKLTNQVTLIQFLIEIFGFIYGGMKLRIWGIYLEYSTKIESLNRSKGEFITPSKKIEIKLRTLRRNFATFVVFSFLIPLSISILLATTNYIQMIFPINLEQHFLIFLTAIAIFVFIFPIIITNHYRKKLDEFI